ncbi:hypothetical protein ERO13_D02G047550v2, partial [Gossypium hirsutum]
SQVMFTSFQAGMIAANGLLGKSCYILLSNLKPMVPSLVETEARLFVTKFLSHFISTGSVILLENGGTMFTFEGTTKKCSLKTVINVHNPHFYWKPLMSTKIAFQVRTAADISLADAYINGDISFGDKRYGFLNVLMASMDTVFFTAGLTSAKYCFKHFSRRNTLTQARRNISRHYDLSNELFALFMDETMAHSCAVFKTEDEDLTDAQQRKFSLLIEEVIPYKQLKLAEKRVKEAGLQENIRFQLCDYRQLPSTYKYDKIISCEMIAAVGHEYMEDFFDCCKSVLVEDGLLVLQFTSIPEKRFDEYRQSSDFIKEYIFPGRVTTAMNAASRLCVEYVGNIGRHYYQTLRHWRKNFLEKQSKINALGFNDKFIRTWEYYFDYCAAGFKSNTLGNYHEYEI